MNDRDKELALEAGLYFATDVNWMPIIGMEYAKKFADLIRADERKRLEQAVEELAPVRDNPLLQNKPAAFWIESFKQIVRGDV